MKTKPEKAMEAKTFEGTQRNAMMNHPSKES
jgi:hypothetical protein